VIRGRSQTGGTILAVQKAANCPNATKHSLKQIQLILYQAEIDQYTDHR